jgi:hypothetical protein
MGRIKTIFSFASPILDNLDILDWYQIDQNKGSAQSNKSDRAISLIYPVY